MIISTNTTPFTADVVLIQGNRRVNMSPFPPPSGLPRKHGFISDGFISVDPWLLFIIQNAPRKPKWQGHWLSILRNWALMRNLSLTKKFLLMQKSGNGLFLPEIPSTWMHSGNEFFLNAHAKGKMKPNCFLHNSEMSLMCQRTGQMFEVWNPSRGRRSCSFSQASCALLCLSLLFPASLSSCSLLWSS